MNVPFLPIATLVAMSGIAANAGVLSLGPPISESAAGPAVGGLPSGPWSFEIPFTLDLTSAGSVSIWTGPFWEVTVSDSVLGPFHVVSIEGSHLVAPHVGETAPSLTAALAILFPRTYPGGGTAFGSVQHHLPPVPDGGDDWLLTLAVDPGGLTASGTVYAWHTAPVPEPAFFGFAAALGLVGFGVLRRVRA